MTPGTGPSLSSLGHKWNGFFHAPADPKVCAAIRIALAIVIGLDFAFALPHAQLFWGENGILPFELSRQIADSNTWTLFSWFPRTEPALWVSYACVLLHVLLLGVGLGSRLNAALLFVWLVSFQQRNVLILSGQDVATRILCFLIVFLPIGEAYAVDARLFPRKDKPPRSGWALRVIQIEMCLIVFSAGVEKLGGSFWWSGDALYYVMHLDDFCCQFPIPDFVRASPILYRPLSWIALAIELAAPILVWFKETRRVALIALISLHLGIEYMMNLVFFEWVMLAGWLSHGRPEDLAWLRRSFRARVRRAEAV